MKITNKVAVVTGAGSGIGRALAMQLAEEGALLAIADISAENLEETYQTVVGKTGEGGILQQVFDVSDKEKVYEYYDSCSSKLLDTRNPSNISGKY